MGNAHKNSAISYSKTLYTVKEHTDNMGKNTCKRQSKRKGKKQRKTVSKS